MQLNDDPRTPIGEYGIGRTAEPPQGDAQRTGDVASRSHLRPYRWEPTFCVLPQHRRPVCPEGAHS